MIIRSGVSHWGGRSESLQMNSERWRESVGQPERERQPPGKREMNPDTSTYSIGYEVGVRRSRKGRFGELLRRPFFFSFHHRKMSYWARSALLLLSRSYLAAVCKALGSLSVRAFSTVSVCSVTSQHFRAHEKKTVFLRLGQDSQSASKRYFILCSFEIGKRTGNFTPTCFYFVGSRFYSFVVLFCFKWDG